MRPYPIPVMMLSRGELKSASDATSRQYMPGQIGQIRSTQEYSRVVTEKTQHAVASRMARSSAVPKGVPCKGCGMKLMSIILYYP